ncbi:hypothetical protein D3C76_1646480 [compost metagenome]
MAVVVGQHQVMGDVHDHVIDRHDALADGAGEGLVGGKVEIMGWIRDDLFHKQLLNA